MLMVAELTFEVNTVLRSFDTVTIWVRFWPVPITQSIFCVPGSYRPTTFAPSAVKYNLPPTNSKP
jgi:hypothetical protein